MELAAANQDSSDHISPLSRLDGRVLRRALERRVLVALYDIWSKCWPEDHRILHPISSFLLDEGPRLDEIRRRDLKASTTLPTGFRDDHPVSWALLDYKAGTGFEGLIRMLSIAVAAGLEAGSKSDRKPLARLTQNIRGAPILVPIGSGVKPAHSWRCHVRWSHRSRTGYRSN